MGGPPILQGSPRTRFSLLRAVFDGVARHDRHDCCHLASRPHGRAGPPRSRPSRWRRAASASSSSPRSRNRGEARAAAEQSRGPRTGSQDGAGEGRVSKLVGPNSSISHGSSTPPPPPPSSPRCRRNSIGGHSAALLHGALRQPGSPLRGPRLAALGKSHLNALIIANGRPRRGPCGPRGPPRRGQCGGGGLVQGLVVR